MKADYERQTSDISAVLTRLNAGRAELANAQTTSILHIRVHENGNISVKFKFADELRKIAEYIEINTTEDTAVAGQPLLQTTLTVCFPNRR